MSELSREAQAIIDAARDADEPTPEDRKRVRAALAVTIGAGSGSGSATAASGGNSGPGTMMNASRATGGSPTLSAATSGGKGALAAKILAGVIVVGSLGYGGYRLFGDDETSAASARPAPAVIEKVTNDVPPSDVIAPQVEATPIEPEPEPTATAKAPDERASKATKKRPRVNSAHAREPHVSDPLAGLREEKKLIGKAKEVLDAGNPSLALKVLDRHAARFANGVLAQDRAGLRVLALCDLGKVERARREAARFLKRWPRAPMAHRVRSACARAEE